MSKSLNQVTLLGNLTRDPELRITQNGTSVVNISLAINRSFKDSSGEWQDAVDYIDVTCWSNLADRVSQYLFKGSRALITGRLQFRSWEQDGKKRSKIDVLASDVIFMDSKKSEEPPKEEKVLPKRDISKAQKEVGTLDDESINLDDIPF